MDDAYAAFLAGKAVTDPMTGLAGPFDLNETMFPFQRDLATWALKRGRAGLFAGTGLGKTLMELAWAQEVMRETKRSLLHLAPLAVTAQIEREGAKFGIQPGTLTNYQKLSHYDLSDFGGVVLDECFAAGTFVDMANGRRKRIENVRIGDKIVNASGIDIVADVHRREVPYAVQVSADGRKIIASPNHPFLTQRGWTAAQDIEPGDRLVAARDAMRMVRGDIHPDRAGRPLLRSILLSEMADAPAGISGEGSHAGGRSEAWAGEVGMVSGRIAGSAKANRSHRRSQPDRRSRGARKNIPHIESHEARSFRAWGQWARHDETAGAATGTSGVGMASGVCLVTGPTHSELSDALQARLGARRAQSRYRGGWSLAWRTAPLGREEGCEAGGIGVDGIEVLKPSDSRLDRSRDADGKLYFYDLGATRHPSFSVAGALVHNSSILKSVDGHYRTRLIEECANIPFRLAATATPSPNDIMEIGNHAEFLGIMSYTDMLATFFVHDGGDTQKWRLKGHAENEFWKWMASWSVMLRKPSDLGYSDDGYDLPPLTYHSHVVQAEHNPETAGTLFPVEAQSLSERISARRDTVADRVAMACEVTPAGDSFGWWCNLNAEADAVAKNVPGAFNLHGGLSEDEKERAILGYLDGSIRVLVSKPSICGFGMNFQHCHRTGFVGLNDSFEQYYQAIRRFWRFGQAEPVDCHVISSSREGAVVANIRRKEQDMERMAEAMVMHTRDQSSMAVRGQVRDTPLYNPQTPMKLPTWLEAA